MSVVTTGRRYRKLNTNNKAGLRSRLIGDKAFYAQVMKVAVPIVIQNGITNFVSLLDNIMVGSVGTNPMSGVTIVGNNLMLVYYLAIFGSLAGAGIFGAQFYGNGDVKGVRHAMRFKLLIGIGITIIGCLILLNWQDSLIMGYLEADDISPNDIAERLFYAKQYLAIMLIGLFPFAIEEAYSSTLRECGETTFPMVAGVVAVFVNLALNYVLIYGNFGFPKLGVEGAAIATVISRYVQMGVVILWTHTHKAKMKFVEGLYRVFTIPAQLMKKIAIKGAPLMMNEILWAAGVAIMMKYYSVRGADIVPALSISSTISNLFNVVFVAMGSAVAIMVGQLLGAGELEKAKETDTRLIAFSVMSCVIMGAILFVVAPLFPEFYETEQSVKNAATVFIRISACCMPMFAFLHSTYFTLRSGGKTWITFLFDSVFMWIASVPLCYVLCNYTSLPIYPLYISCQMVDLGKCVLGFILVKKGIWIQNIVQNEK